MSAPDEAAITRVAIALFAVEERINWDSVDLIWPVIDESERMRYRLKAAKAFRDLAAMKAMEGNDT